MVSTASVLSLVLRYLFIPVPTGISLPLSLIHISGSTMGNDHLAFPQLPGEAFSVQKPAVFIMLWLIIADSDLGKHQMCIRDRGYNDLDELFADLKK